MPSEFENHIRRREEEAMVVGVGEEEEGEDHAAEVEVFNNLVIQIDNNKELMKMCQTISVYLWQQGKYAAGRPRNTNRGGSHARLGEERRMPLLGYRKLVEFQSKEPPELLSTLNHSKSGFRELLSSDSLKPDWIQLVLALLTKACTCSSSPQLLIQLLNIVKDSKFLSVHLVMYIGQMGLESSVYRQEEFKEPIKEMLKIFRELLIRLPQAAVATVLGPLSMLRSTIIRLQVNSDIIDEDIELQLAEVNSLSEAILKTEQEGGAGCDMAVASDDQPPSDDFRNVPIFPTHDDINLKEEPFLRANKTHGRYQDVNHYLDVQFRLLREDFVRPLREGITKFSNLGSINRRDERLQDIRIYHDVYVVNPVCTINGLVYRIRFAVSKLKGVRWESTKRLIFGSLVCLSQDRFKTLLFATVANRNPKDLAKGFLELRFEQRRGEVHRISPATSFIMAETTAYFEACRHVLFGLQTIEEDEFPLKRYIVHCENEVAPPKYLLERARNKAAFDLSPLTEDTLVKRQEPLLQLQDDTGNDDYLPVESVAGKSARQVLVLITSSWPSAEVFHLDESQMQALKTVLTKEIAVIQGPPGTGKTYLGLKIAQALLHNKAVWGGDTPVLVVCYTNHALDQFLEGIHTFIQNGIVRVGGRSKSKALEKFFIRNLKDEMRQNKKVPRGVLEGLNDARSEMKEIELQIENIVARIEQTDQGILHEDTLRPFIDHVHYRSLTEFRQPQGLGWPFEQTSQRNSNMLDWLGFGNNLYSPGDYRGFEEGEVPEKKKKGNEYEVEQLEEEEEEEEEEEDEKEEEVIEVEEEADLLQEQRIIDDAEEDVDFSRLRRRVAISDFPLALDFDTLSISEFGSTKDGEDMGWQVQNRTSKKRKKIPIDGFRNKNAMSEDEAGQVGNVWTLSDKDRWRLYHLWITKYCTHLKEGIEGYEEQYEEVSARMREIKNQQDLIILKEAAVIGMTTIGAAKYRSILQEVQPKIVIVEEAAEVLEAHIVTSLTKSCQHLILIGDHKQLRPTPTVCELAKKYNLDVSLFERMVKNGMQVDCLKLQHRMRPEIATLLRHIYPELENHPSVEDAEDIRGVSKNMFFINHSYPEVKDGENRSRSNKHEAKFMVALCKYLLLQGYGASQITILTTYTGQLLQFKKIMPKTTFQGVRVSSVDNFQGEENDIILLSLVRSNTEGNMGFLAIQNRICVVLSRAKKGFYVIGNFRLLAENNMWSKIIYDLRKCGSIGEGLRLYCQNHPENGGILAKTDLDFKEAPEGGCLLPCEYRLPCRHVCKKVCHSYDKEHANYRCMEPCMKTICKRMHQCTKLCFEECGKCMKMVDKVMPACGHKQSVACSVDPYLVSCNQPCDVKLPCGHECRNKCGEEHTKKCNKVCRRLWPCGHVLMTYCHRTPETFPCPTPCGAMLECGHKCAGACGKCRQGRLHMPCQQKCNRNLVCGHPCKDTCTKNCPPCQRPCENRCVHSKCQKTCGEPCVPCMEACSWECKHHICRKLCSEPCDRPPCNEPCSRMLRCRHPCIGLCGEPCPKLCRVCNGEEVTKIFFGTEDEEDARFVQLTDCKHYFEVSGLDQYFAMESSNSTNMSIQLKCCPLCKTPIRRNLRYGKQINTQLANIELVKRKLAVDMHILLTTHSRLQREISDIRQTDLIGLSHAQNILAYFETKITGGTVSGNHLAFIENQINFIKRVSGMKAKLVDQQKETEKYASELKDIMKELTSLYSWIVQPRSHMSQQETTQFSAETTRLALLGNWFIMKTQIENSGRTLPPELSDQFDQTKTLLCDKKPLSPEREAKVKRIYSDVKQACPASGLRITDTERQEIVQAMGLTQGHWFKCPNGHIYAIGDCGGAMEEATCPECKACIGGQSHRLRDDNQLAGEMDGARHAAWSEAANMANYEGF
ncbi:NFX1-type zinc finger-containing protein 1-like [Lingula anatina]|uniref:NFX1-type zinc finger-containing protein 1-like n=1 Tax=Lingula anatina TaxID=7574 RepID=A0A1S3H6T7_LINAN|nr:NFX1-type zinc finger-containing protein 1-like [Lingula anatina]|eukprot:XP_013381835.1 NFX1-type zinc finger-containing protein 1-like [Lingula anatina]